MKDSIKAYLQKHIKLANLLLEGDCIEKLVEIAGIVSNTLVKDGKVVLFGNGGSAADAQHIATELIGKFRRERAAIPALALNTNNSVITAVANDYSYDRVFARQVEALVDKDDIVIGISTSGTSPSVIEGIKAANQKGARTIGFTGKSGGRLKDVTDICLMVPSDETPHIQEMHITLGHILCLLVEDGVPARKSGIRKRAVKKLNRIAVIAMDIDGVLTDGTVTVSGGEESKSLFYRDMDAINHGKRQGLKFVLVTAEATPFVENISRRLDIDPVIKGAKDKTEAINRLSAELNIPLEQICYIGDSKRDAAAIGMVGFGLAPADADKEAQDAAFHVLEGRGGKGAVSEAVYLVLGHNTLVQESD